MKVELWFSDLGCENCGKLLDSKNNQGWCETCSLNFCESCAEENIYCPECWDNEQDGYTNGR